MRIIEGCAAVPVIYTAHHASHEFGEFADRVALSKEQQIRFSDYGSDITVPLNGLATIVAGRSRALGDLNRNPDDPGRFQSQDYGKPNRHNIWLPGQELTDEEKKYCQEQYYEPFHDKVVELLAERTEPTVVVAWDNTAHYEIGEDEAGQQVIMKPIILSNRGKEGSAEPGAEPVSCDPRLLRALAIKLSKELSARGLPSEVYTNLVYKGGYICRTYSSLRHQTELEGRGVSSAVQSIQVEYDTALTHNQETLEINMQNATSLREGFEASIKQAYWEYVGS